MTLQFLWKVGCRSVGLSAIVCLVVCLVVVLFRIKEEQGWEPGAKVGGKFIQPIPTQFSSKPNVIG